MTADTVLYGYITKFVHYLSVIAIILNAFLFIIVLRYSSKVGSFKYLLLVFAVLEVLYSVVVCVTTPIFYTYDYRVVVFSYNSMLADSPFASFASGLYCTFYELWISFVGFMFFHRYICLCREHFRERVSASFKLKCLCFGAYIVLAIYCVICGTFFCTLDKIPKAGEDEIKEQFGLQDVKYLGYQVTALIAEDGSFTWTGFMAFNNHVVLVMATSIIIMFCGYKNWKKIKALTKMMDSGENRRNRQIMMTLLFQGSVPLLMYQIPCITNLLSSLIFSQSLLGRFTPLMSVFSTMPKILDPLSTLLIIKEYRYGVVHMFRSAIGKTRIVSMSEGHSAPTSTVHPLSEVAKDDLK